MTENFLNKNLEILSAHHKGTFELLTKFREKYRDSDYQVTEAKSGELTLTVTDALGKLISYHSKYNPIKESQQIIASSYKGESHAVVFGFGLGYVSELLLEKMPNKNYGRQLFIVEPDPFVLLTALKYRDLKQLLSDDRVMFFLGTDADYIGEVWSNTIDWSVLDGMSIIEQGPSKTRFSSFFNKLLERMKYMANHSRGNLVTLMNVGYEFHTNNFLNLPEAFGLPGAERFFNKFRNVPCVVVAAGPSLDKNLEYLKEIKGKFPIIAVDTAYRNMIANGIKPDIVCAADSSYENSLDFVGVESEVEVIIVTELMTHPDILKVFKGPKVITTFGGGLYPQICSMREPFGKLICWGSVTTMAFDLARNMGADPIVFIGFDLSFCDGRLHTRGSYSEDILFEGLNHFTSMENATAEYICERGRFKFVGDGGQIIYTDSNMKAYKDWFEEQFKHTKARIINATEGGIVDKFVTKMTFLEAMETYLDKGVDVGNILKSALKPKVMADYETLIADFQNKRDLIYDYKEKVRKIWTVYGNLSKTIADKGINEIKHIDTGDFAAVMKLHDSICGNGDIVRWFAALYTKFVTKHTSDVIKLRNSSDATGRQWLELVARLFSAYEDFSLYQIPLLDKALFELREKYVKIMKDER